jgi:ethanolamine ammonia-lyase large subunit
MTRYIKFECLEYTRVEFDMEITEEDYQEIKDYPQDKLQDWVHQKETTEAGFYDWNRGKEWIETSEPPENFEFKEYT